MQRHINTNEDHRHGLLFHRGTISTHSDSVNIKYPDNLHFYNCHFFSPPGLSQQSPINLPPFYFSKRVLEIENIKKMQTCTSILGFLKSPGITGNSRSLTQPFRLAKLLRAYQWQSTMPGSMPNTKMLWTGPWCPLTQSCLQRCPHPLPVNSQWSLDQSGANAGISNGRNPNQRTANTGHGTTERESWKRRSNSRAIGREQAPWGIVPSRAEAGSWDASLAEGGPEP